MNYLRRILGSGWWRWPRPRRWKLEGDDWVLDLPPKISEEWNVEYKAFRAELEKAVREDADLFGKKHTEDTFRRAIRIKVQKLREKGASGMKIPMVSSFRKVSYAYLCTC